jgi:hypothetical protein
MTFSLRFILLPAFGLMLPVAGFAHSTEFIFAKVTPGEGKVNVELTADYGGNPMLEDETAARAILSKLLRVHLGRANTPLTKLTRLSFEERTQFDPSTPIPPDPVGESHPHQLLCAVTSLQCNTDKLAFEVEMDSGQTVILWKPPESPGAQPRWVFLLPGEISPEIQLPRSPRPGWVSACIGIGIFGFWPLLALTFQRSRATRLLSPA